MGGRRRRQFFSYLVARALVLKKHLTVTAKMKAVKEINMQGAIENLRANRNPHLTKWKQNNTVFCNDCFRHFISVMFPLFSL